MDNVSQDPILAEDSISSQNGSTSSKKWKKSTFIFGGIMGLVVLIPIVFSIFNVVENSNLKHEILRLEAKLELEVGKNAKTMETNLNKIQSQQDQEIKNREQENEKLFVAIEDNSNLKHEISRLEAKLVEVGKNAKHIELIVEYVNKLCKIAHNKNCLFWKNDRK